MYIPKKITASGDATFAKRTRLQKVVLVGGSADSSVIVFDGATQAGGTDIGKIAAKAGDTRELCLDGYVSGDGGMSFTVAGTGAVVYLYTD